MKRTSALETLSRDHHHALVVAQKLRRATPQTMQAARTVWLAFWPAGRDHFRAEEELLLPAYASHALIEKDPAVTQVLLDHVTIRQHAAQLDQGPEVRLETLHALGGVLDDHVRLEERELFPRIEAAIPDHELAVLADALDRPSPPS